MKETWRYIPDWEGYYEASSEGRIRSVNRQITHPINGIINRKGKMLLMTVGQNGYIKTCLTRNGVKKYLSVHRLIALTFISNPKNKACVNHLDGNKINNEVFNLEWCTQSENIKHAYRNKLMTAESRRGEKNNFSLLTEDDVHMIRKLYAKGFSSMKQIGQIFDVADETIREVIVKQTWKHVKDKT